jgi:hypothetical protein
MKTSDSSDVIQGDEHCRDGHYRAKQDLCTKTVILPCLGRTEEDIQATGKQFLTIGDSMGIINPTQGFL